MNQRVLLAVLLSLLAQTCYGNKAQAAPQQAHSGLKANGQELLLAQAAGESTPPAAPATEMAGSQETNAPANAETGKDAAQPPAKTMTKEEFEAKRALERKAQQEAEAKPAFSEHQNKGIELFGKNKTDEAIAEFSKSHDISPNNTGILMWMGSCYQKKNDQKKAAELYEKIVEIDPDYAEAHNNLAFSYQAMNDLEKAETEYARALQLKPELNEARFNYGCVLQSEGKYPEALPIFEELLKVDPSRTDCYLRIGNVAKECKELDKAAEFYNKALAELKKSGKKDPQGLAEIICLLAIIDGEKGNKDKCKDGLDKTLDLDPGNYLAHLHLGMMSFEAKDFTACLNSLGKALERNPYDAAVHFWLGRCYFSLDSMNNSIKQFTDCLKCDASEHKFPECEEWLDKAKKRKASF